MKKCVSAFLCLALVGAAGCGGDAVPEAVDTGSEAVSAVDRSKYLLSEEPAGAENVIALRESAKEKDEIVIVGRIGGSENPWIDDFAAFTIVDTSLKSCLEVGSDQCPKPWDFC